MIQRMLTAIPPEVREDFQQTVNVLVERKQKHFASIKRAIVDWEVTDIKDGFHLTVVSLPSLQK